LKAAFGVQTLHELTYQFALSPDRLIDDGPVPAGGGTHPMASEAAAESAA
jgi:hypothetical protein